MSGSPLPPGPWLDSEAARAVGPVEFVCRPRPWAAFGRGSQPGCSAALAVLLLAGATLLFVQPCRSPRGPLGIATTFEDYLLPPLGLLVGGLLFSLVLALTIRKTRREMGERLLVGAHGLAFWGPAGERVVLWAELGVRWKCVPEHTDSIGLVLAQADGTTVRIDDYFTEHRRVVARVLEELARASDRPPEQPTQPSQAIMPDDHGVVEPDL